MLNRTNFFRFVCCSVPLLFNLTGCDEAVLPKPVGYHRIDTPEHQYRNFNPQHCPYSFDIDLQARIDTNVADNQQCWFNITYPAYNAVIHCSYHDLSESSLAQRIEDVHTLVMKHTVKANDITDQYFTIPKRNVSGIKYNFLGSTATSYQFFLTDSTNHFLRGALYFNNVPNPDSVQPMKTFIEEDINQLITTFHWKE